MSGIVEDVDCPLCGGVVEEMVFRIPGPSAHHGWRCLRCGFATCNHGSALGSSGRLIPPLAHLHLHVDRELRTLVRWTPKQASWRPLKTKHRPWWPQCKSFRLKDRDVVIMPARRDGKLLWQRLDLAAIPPANGEPFKLPPSLHQTVASYPTFQTAFTATPQAHDAIATIQAAPPKIVLLRGG